MNEYNERILKNVLEDLREENDEEFLKEIAAAAADPMYANKEGEADRVAKKYARRRKKNYTKYLKIAVVLLVFVLSVTVIPVPVNGAKETIVQLVYNRINPDHITIGGGTENSRLLAEYQGQYVPSIIPDGYKVDLVENDDGRKILKLINYEDYYIAINEIRLNAATGIDSNGADSIVDVVVLGYSGVILKKGERTTVSFMTEDICVSLLTNDPAIDLLQFAETLEKR